MSISINNLPYVKLDPARDDVQPSALSKANAPTSTFKTDSARVPSAVQHDNARGPQGDMMISTSSLSKLFDMLEQVFKAMREMVSGKNITPDLSSNTDKAAKLTPEAKDQAKVLADRGAMPKVAPDAKDQAKVLPDGGVMPKVAPDAKEQAKVRPDGGVLPKVAPDVMDKKLRPDEGAPQVLTPTPTPRFVPAVPKPTVNVTNEANAQVKVEVNVSHCHCPGTTVEHDKGRSPRVTPDNHQPRSVPQPDARVVPDAKPGVLPKADLQPQPGITPHPDGKVAPDAKPGVLPKADLQPQPGITPHPDGKVAPDAKPGVLPKADLKPQPGVTPQPKVVPEADTNPKVNPDVPKPDVTSPGPAENQDDLKGWSFISHRRLRT